MRYCHALILLLVGWLLTPGFTPSAAAQTNVQVIWNVNDYTDNPARLTRFTITPLGVGLGENWGRLRVRTPTVFTATANSYITNGWVTNSLLTGQAYQIAASTAYATYYSTNFYPTNIAGSTVYGINYSGDILNQSGDNILSFSYRYPTITNVTAGGGSGSFDTNTPITMLGGVTVGTNGGIVLTSVSASTGEDISVAAGNNSGGGGAGDLSLSAGDGSSGSNPGNVTVRGGSGNIPGSVLVKSGNTTIGTFDFTGLSVAGTVSATALVGDGIGLTDVYAEDAVTWNGHAANYAGLLEVAGGILLTNAYYTNTATVTVTPTGKLALGTNNFGGGGGGVSAAQVAAQISTNGPQLLFARNYGAVGDGSTDDTAALQLAIEAANNQTNGSKAGYSAGRTALVLEAGWYRTTAPLYIYGKNGLEIRGSGGPGQCIISNSTTTLMIVTNAANAQEPNNLIIDNIAFRSTGYSQTGLLFCATLNTMDNMVVKNCSLYGFKTALMMYSDNTLGGVSNSRFDNVDLFDNWYGLIVTNGLYNANRIEGTFVNNYASAFVIDKGMWDIYMRDSGGELGDLGYTTTNILWITGSPKILLHGGQCEYYGWTNKAAIWATGTGGYDLLMDGIVINAYSDSKAWAGAVWSVNLEDSGASTSYAHFQDCRFQVVFTKTNYTANFAMPGSPAVRVTSREQRVTASGPRVVGGFFESGIFVTNLCLQQDPIVVANNSANVVGAGAISWGYKQWMLTNGVPKLFMATADGLVQMDSRGISTSFAGLSISNTFTGSNFFNGDTIFASAKKTRFLTDGSTGVRLQATAASRGVSWIANTFNTHDWGFFTPTSNDTEPTWNTAAARVYHDTANNRTHVGYNAVGSTAPYGTATFTVYGSYGGQTSAAPASVVAPVKWMTFIETNGSSYRIPLYQ